MDETLIPNVFGTTELKLKTLLAFGRKKTFEMKKINTRIKDNAAKKRVESIIIICNDIFIELQNNPSAIKKLRRFFNYYLDSVVKIISKYESISNFKYDIENRDMILKKTMDSLNQICNSFESLLKSLKEADADDLDLEIQVMANSLNAEFLNKLEKSK